MIEWRALLTALRRLLQTRFLALFFRGTFAPFLRASDRPMAIACFRLFTFPPLPPGPLLSVPFLRRFIALSTRLFAALPYFLPLFFRPPFFAAMLGLPLPEWSTRARRFQEPFQCMGL